MWACQISKNSMILYCIVLYKFGANYIIKTITITFRGLLKGRLKINAEIRQQSVKFKLMNIKKKRRKNKTNSYLDISNFFSCL